MKLETKKALCVLAIVIGILNFIAYVTIAGYLGGDAVNGHTENGHYFLMSHGKATEVSEAVYNYSRIHTYTVWITHPLALISGWILSLLKRDERAASKSTALRRDYNSLR
jgi:hypothetical protein